MTKCRHVEHGAGLHSVCGSGQRERCTQPHTDTHAWSMKVASLVMVERVCTTRRRCVVSGRLVCKARECVRVGVEQRRCEPPWFMLRSRGRVKIFDVLTAEALVPGLVC